MEVDMVVASSCNSVTGLYSPTTVYTTLAV